jgi:hypothetical protein
MATNARKTMNVGPALPLSWKWSVQETLSMDVEESTVQAGSPAPSGAAAPKRSRKKKLKFDDSPRESLGRVFSRIAGGQEVRAVAFFCFGAVSERDAWDGADECLELTSWPGV